MTGPASDPAPTSRIAATVRFTLGTVPFFDGVVDGRCLSITSVRPTPGIPGLIEDTPNSRITIQHVDACECGDRSSALVVNIPTAHLDVNVTAGSTPDAPGRVAR